MSNIINHVPQCCITAAVEWPDNQSHRSRKPLILTVLVSLQRPPSSGHSIVQARHIDARRITYICGLLLLLLFLAAYLALAGLNLLAQISDRIHHFTALNSVHLRELG